MLPAAYRMRSSKVFDATVRKGVRAGRPTVVVHALCSPDREPDDGKALVGFVVSKKVGNAVVRNRVKRRLRHMVAPRVGGLCSGTSLVVRALPAAASEPDRLADDLDAAWRESLRRLEVRR